MGDILTATCNCGYTSTILAGGGMRDFSTYCKLPALCLDCKTFTAVNYLAKSTRCKNCSSQVTFYHQPPLQSGKEGDHQSFSWNMRDETIVLYATPYYCPGCHQESLRFYACGNWD